MSRVPGDWRLTVLLHLARGKHGQAASVSLHQPNHLFIGRRCTVAVWLPNSTQRPWSANSPSGPQPLRLIVTLVITALLHSQSRVIHFDI